MPPRDDRPDSAVKPASSQNRRADVLALFLRLLPIAFLDQLLAKQGLRHHNRVYTAGVVMWLMICQRLQEIGTLETAVLELVRGLPPDFWPKPCKRLQPDRPQGRKLSSHTGAYGQARRQLPVSIVEQAFDHVFQQLTEQTTAMLPAPERRAFFLDGTSVRLPHTKPLAEIYPPASNQHGASHWPLIRMLVAHDLYTGLAMRPQWGPLYGPQAVSEQGLLEQAVDRLPSGSLVVGDANFGVFSVAYATTQRAHPVLLRLTAARARRLAGEPLRDGIDRRIHWRPSRDDRKNHPALPADACVAGRLIVTHVQPNNEAEPFLLALFTTLADPIGQVVKIYGQRWNIETDLRSLKDTLRLEHLTCTSAEMVAREIDMAMMAYNLVSAISCLAAHRAGLPPRAFSFTRVRNVINAFGPLIAAATDPQQVSKLWDDMLYYVGQARLPTRKRKRPSYPRAVWGRPQVYPKRKA